MSRSENRVWLILDDEREYYCRPGLNYVNADRELLLLLRRQGCSRVVFLDGSAAHYTLTAYDEASFNTAASCLKTHWGKRAVFTPVDGRDRQTLEKDIARKVSETVLRSDRDTALVTEAETYAELGSAELPRGKGKLILRSTHSAGELRRLLLNREVFRELLPGLKTPIPIDLFAALRRELGDAFLDRRELCREELENMVSSAMLRNAVHYREESCADMAAVLYYSFYSRAFAEKTLLKLRRETPRRQMKERLEKPDFLLQLQNIAGNALEGGEVGSLWEKLHREYPLAIREELREENRLTRLLSEERLRSAVPQERHGVLDALRDFCATPWNRTLSEEAERHLADALGYLVMMYEHGQQRNADRLLIVLRDNVCTAAILEKAENVSNAVSLYAQTCYQLASYEESEKKIEETVAEKREKKEQCHQYIREMGENGNIVRRWKMYLDAERVAEAQLERLRAEKQVLYDTRETLEQGLTEYRLSHRSFSEQQLERFKADMERIARQQTAQELPNLAESVSTQTASADMSGVWDAYYEEHPEEQRQNIRRMKRLL